MPIIDDVSNQMKDAMRAKESARLMALRNIRSAFIVAMKKDGADTLTDAQCVDSLRSLAKQRRDSIEAYEAAQRPDLADPEKAELAVIEGFLPVQAGEEQVRAWVVEAIAATGATTPAHVGKVVGAVLKAHKADVDGGAVKALATSLLGG